MPFSAICRWRHSAFRLSVCPWSYTRIKFVNTILYAWQFHQVYNLSACWKMNWLDLEVESSKVKVTTRQIWSKKHFGKFEGHALKRQGHRQPFWRKHTDGRFPVEVHLYLQYSCMCLCNSRVPLHSFYGTSDGLMPLSCWLWNPALVNCPAGRPWRWNAWPSKVRKCFLTTFDLVLTLTFWPFDLKISSDHLCPRMHPFLVNKDVYTLLLLFKL